MLIWLRNPIHWNYYIVNRWNSSSQRRLFIKCRFMNKIYLPWARTFYPRIYTFSSILLICLHTCQVDWSLKAEVLPLGMKIRRRSWLPGLVDLSKWKKVRKKLSIPTIKPWTDITEQFISILRQGNLLHHTCFKDTGHYW